MQTVHRCHGELHPPTRDVDGQSAFKSSLSLSVEPPALANRMVELGGPSKQWLCNCLHDKEEDGGGIFFV